MSNANPPCPSGRRAALLPLLAVALGCAATPGALDPAYRSERVDTIKHVTIVVRQVAVLEPSGQRLFGRAAFAYLDEHSTLLIHDYGRSSSDTAGRELCRFDGRDMDAVLFVTPRRLAGTDAGVEVAAAAALVDCRDSAVLWSYRAGAVIRPGRLDATPFAGAAATDLGEELRPLAGPVYRLTGMLLRSLGKPRLDDRETEERAALHARQR